MKKRVEIPKQDPKRLLDLVTKVREKHLLDGEASPLKVLNWDEISPEIDEALEIEERALRLKREKLKIYQQRSHRLQRMLRIARDSRDILAGVHSVEMKALGLWGFDVLDTRVNTSREKNDAPAVS